MLPLPKGTSLNPLAKLPSLQQTSFFQKHLQLKLYEIPKQSQIQQFLPFDPTIIEIFDEQELCNYPILTDLILPSDYYTFGNNWFGSYQTQIQRIKNFISQLPTTVGLQQGTFYVRAFIMVPSSHQLQEQIKKRVYKTYRVNRIAEKQQEGSQKPADVRMEQCTDEQLPFDITIKQAGITSLNINAIVLHPQPEHFGDYGLSIFLQEERDQSRKKIYTINSSPKTTDGSAISCCTIEMTVKQLVLMEKQLHGFYKGWESSLRHQATYYLNQGVPQFQYRLISLHKYENIATSEHQILQLSSILHYFHSELSLTLSNTSYLIMPSAPTSIAFFTNFTSTDPIQSRKQNKLLSEEVIYDLIMLIGSILDSGYTGPYRKQMEDIMDTVVNEKEVTEKWNQIIASIQPSTRQHKKEQNTT